VYRRSSKKARPWAKGGTISKAELLEEQAAACEKKRARAAVAARSRERWRKSRLGLRIRLEASSVRR
jgi:hypothetical protein